MRFKESRETPKTKIKCPSPKNARRESISSKEANFSNDAIVFIYFVLFGMGNLIKKLVKVF